jgi:hypothetical protein
MARSLARAAEWLHQLLRCQEGREGETPAPQMYPRWRAADRRTSLFAANRCGRRRRTIRPRSFSDRVLRLVARDRIPVWLTHLCCFLANFHLARRLLYTHSDYAARYRLSQFLQTVIKFARNLEEFA